MIMECPALGACRGGDCAAGGVGEAWHAQGAGGAAAGGALVHLGELVPGAGEADLQALGFAEPAGFFGFGDAGGEVAADLHQAGTLGGVGAEQRAAQAGVLVDARGVVGAAAVAEGDLAAFEMAKELVPFLIGGGPVFLSRAQGATAGDERPVAIDDLFGVDRPWRRRILELSECLALWLG